MIGSEPLRNEITGLLCSAGYDMQVIQEPSMCVCGLTAVLLLFCYITFYFLCCAVSCYKSAIVCAGRLICHPLNVCRVFCNRKLHGTDPGRVSDCGHMGGTPGPACAPSGGSQAVLFKLAASVA